MGQHRQSQFEIHIQYYPQMKQQIEEFKKQSNKPILYYMVDLQNSLMIDIIKRKILPTWEQSRLTFKDLAEKTILAMFDEFVEIKNWIDELPNAEHIVRLSEYKVECRYEVIDIYHFLLQLLLIVNIINDKLNNQIDNYVSDKTYQKVIVEKVVNDMMSTFNFTFDTPYKNVTTYNDLVFEGFVKLSKLLNLFPWKYWKTYKEQDYNIDYSEFLKVTNELHEILSELFINFDGKRSLEDLIIHYMTKNHENFDRQKRGY